MLPTKGVLNFVLNCILWSCITQLDLHLCLSDQFEMVDINFNVYQRNLQIIIDFQFRLLRAIGEVLPQIPSLQTHNEFPPLIHPCKESNLVFSPRLFALKLEMKFYRRGKRRRLGSVVLTALISREAD